jgi:hypothetical protein
LCTFFSYSEDFARIFTVYFQKNIPLQKSKSHINIMSKNLFQPLFFSLFVTIAFVACVSNDPCKNTDCGQSASIPTGECVEGVCECNQNYEGDYCADEYSFKFVGFYLGNESQLNISVPVDTLFKDITYDITPALPIDIKRAKSNYVSISGLANSNLNTFIVPVSKANVGLPSALKIVCTNLLGVGTAFDRKLTMDATYNPGDKTITGTYTLNYSDKVLTKTFVKVTKGAFTYKKQ